MKQLSIFCCKVCVQFYFKPELYTQYNRREGPRPMMNAVLTLFWSSPRPWWMTSGQSRHTEVLDHHSNHPVKSHMALYHPRHPSATLSPSQWSAKKMNPLRRHPSRLLQKDHPAEVWNKSVESSGCLWFLAQSLEIVPGNYSMLALGPFTSLWWVFMITCRS